jgi:hypothetical protein
VVSGRGGRGVPRGNLITMCHMVVCDSPSDDELGRDHCLSDDGSPLSRLSLFFQKDVDSIPVFMKIDKTSSNRFYRFTKNRLVII